MDKAAIKELISYLKKSLAQNGLSVGFVAVFGSAMRGDMQKDSDLDLIIVSDDFNGKNIFETAKMTMKAEMATQRKFGIPMDILNMSPEEYRHKKLIDSIVFES